MRPRNINEVIGQKHILGKGKPLYNMVKTKKMFSMILYGRPGIGKTSIANAIAGSIDMTFRKVNAVTDKKKDLENIVKEAQKEEKTIVLAVDEIHRYTKTQSEYLLPFIEDGTIILVGMTTENPYHNIRPAIRSRCSIFELNPLEESDIEEGIKKSIEDKERGLGNDNISINDESVDYLVQASGGDLRNALNKLEMLSSVVQEEEITVDIIKNNLQENNLYIDKDGDGHYDTLSAFHKSLRGSDVDASLLYLAILLEAGDLTGIYRRIIAVAYEDVGLASDMGVKVMAGIEASETVGLKEARIPLANLVIELCLSPKSNSAISAIDKAIDLVKTGIKIEIPKHLKDGHYKGAKKLGNSIGYQFPHNYNIGPYGGWVAQQYLPNNLVNETFYNPKEIGNETRLKKLNEKFKQQQLKNLQQKKE